jgi:hypothetical protein
VLLHRVEPAELDRRGAAGLIRPHARASLLVHQQVEGRVKLVVDLAIDAIAPGQVAPQGCDARGE